MDQPFAAVWNRFAPWLAGGLAVMFVTGIGQTLGDPAGIHGHVRSVPSRIAVVGTRVSGEARLAHAGSITVGQPGPGGRLRHVTHFFARDKLTFAAAAERSFVANRTIAEIEGRPSTHHCAIWPGRLVSFRQLPARESSLVHENCPRIPLLS